MVKQMTICIVYEHPKILLGMKKRGFGEGRWNGFGGKVKEGEAIEEAAKRELLEEASLHAEVDDLDKQGIIEFRFEGDSDVIEVHVFRVGKYDGDICESDEMRPKWFHVGEIPYSEMWPADKYWIPTFLEGKKFNAQVFFKDQNIVLDYKVTELV